MSVANGAGRGGSTHNGGVSYGKRISYKAITTAFNLKILRIFQEADCSLFSVYSDYFAVRITP